MTEGVSASLFSGYSRYFREQELSRAGNSFIIITTGERARGLRSTKKENVLYLFGSFNGDGERMQFYNLIPKTVGVLLFLFSPWLDLFLKGLSILDT